MSATSTSLFQTTQSTDSGRLIVQSEIQLSELISAMSTALDVTEGQPPGHAARTCMIGMRIAEEIRLSHSDRDDIPHDKVIEIMRKDLGTALCPETFEALLRWLDKTTITPRVEAQLEKIDRLTREVSQQKRTDSRDYSD